MAQEKRGRGRPVGSHTITPELQRKIVKAILNGAVREHAVVSCGVGKTTFYRWMKDGRRNGERYAVYKNFRNAILKAEADCAVKTVGVIQKAANGFTETTVKETLATDGTVTRREKTSRKVFDWAAGSWWLKVRYPDHFGEHSKELKELREEVKKLAAFVDAMTAAHPTQPATPTKAPDERPTDR